MKKCIICKKKHDRNSDFCSKRCYDKKRFTPSDSKQYKNYLATRRKYTKTKKFKEYYKKYGKKYHQTEKFKKWNREHQRKYQKTEKFKKWHRKYYRKHRKKNR